MCQKFYSLRVFPKMFSSQHFAYFMICPPVPNFAFADVPIHYTDQAVYCNLESKRILNYLYVQKTSSQIWKEECCTTPLQWKLSCILLTNKYRLLDVGKSASCENEIILRFSSEWKLIIIYVTSNNVRSVIHPVVIRLQNRRRQNLHISLLTF